MSAVVEKYLAKIGPWTTQFLGVPSVDPFQLSLRVLRRGTGRQA